MKMKSYDVKVRVYGTVTISVDAPDDQEAEEIAFSEIHNEDWNDWDLDFEVAESEEVDGSYDG
jgi:hypothetical protein